MATQDVLNESEINRTSERRKWFSLKRWPSKKDKIIQNIVEKQEALSGKIATLVEDRRGLQNELANTNKCMADMSSKITDFLDTTHYKKEFDDEIKRQLIEGRSEHAALADELRYTTKEKHRLELEVCRLEAQVQKLESELQLVVKELNTAEASLTKSKNKINNMKEENLDLNLEIQRQEGVQRELNLDFQLQKEKITLLKQETESGHGRLEKWKEERGNLLEYLKYKSEIYEDRLRRSWLQISELKQEINHLKGSSTSTKRPEILNNEAYQRIPPKNTNLQNSSELENQKTRILQLELQLYRRKKLIEILVDKLKQYDQSFSLMTDTSLLAYLDENWTISETPPSTETESVLFSSESAIISSHFSSESSVLE